MATYYCSPRAFWFRQPDPTVTIQPSGWHPPPDLGPPIDTSKTHYRFTPDRPVRARLRDADVDRIARRVVDLLRNAKP